MPIRAGHHRVKAISIVFKKILFNAFFGTYTIPTTTVPFFFSYQFWKERNRGNLLSRRCIVPVSKLRRNVPQNGRRHTVMTKKQGNWTKTLNDIYEYMKTVEI